MGLDQFAYRVKKGFIKEPVDFRTEPAIRKGYDVYYSSWW